MKKNLLLAFLVLYSFTALNQDCGNYYFLVQNSEIEMTLFDKKGKESGKHIYKISDVITSGNGIRSKMNFQGFDDKGKQLSSGEGKFKCNNGSIDVDMRVSMPSEQMAAYKNMEVKSEEAYLSYPAKIEVGQSLPDGKFNMEVINNGAPFSAIIFDVVNRKVIGNEEITTPAGKWACYKIEYDAAMNIKTMGIGVPINMKVTEWFAPGFGVIKTETNNKSGKLMGSTLLTKLKK